MGEIIASPSQTANSRGLLRVARPSFQEICVPDADCVENMMQDTTSILFVDDDPNILEAFRRSFYQSPYVILTAPSARDALVVLQYHPVDVVVADLHMPHMNGIDFLHRVRALWPHIVRIALTGDGRTAAIEQAIRCGDVFRYLTKPWDLDDFISILAAAVRERALLRTATAGNSRNRPTFTFELIRSLKERLVEEGIIDETQLRHACEVAQNTGSSLGDLLIRLGYCSEDRLLDFISRHAKLPRIRISDMDDDPGVVHMVPLELLERYHLLPLSRRGSRVVVAMADAANLMIVDEIQAFYGIEIEPVLCAEAELQEALWRLAKSARSRGDKGELLEFSLTQGSKSEGLRP